MIRHEYTHCAQQQDTESRRLDDLPEGPPPSASPPTPDDQKRLALYNASKALRQYIRSVGELHAMYYQSRLMRRRIEETIILPQDPAKLEELQIRLRGYHVDLSWYFWSETNKACVADEAACDNIGGASDGCPITLDGGSTFSKSDFDALKRKTWERKLQYFTCTDEELLEMLVAIETLD